ncbi:hypothetical protein Tco_0507213, partial [Tanacetum coccineum]
PRQSRLRMIKSCMGNACVSDVGFEEVVENVTGPKKGCVMGHNNEIGYNIVEGIQIVGQIDPLSTTDGTNRHGANEENKHDCLCVSAER